MPEKRKYITLDIDGKKKKVPWTRDEDPTPEQLETLADGPEFKESKPGFFQGVKDVVLEPIMETGRSSAKHLMEGNIPAAFGDIVRPIMYPFEGITRAATTGIEKPGVELAENAGIPYSLMKDSYDSGQYSRLAGQGITALGMFGASARSAFKPKAKPTDTGTKTTSVNTPEPPKPTGDLKPLIDTSTLPPAIKNEFNPTIGEQPKVQLPNPLERMYEHVRENQGRAPKINLNEIKQSLPLEFADTSVQPNLKGSKLASAGMKADTPSVAAFEGLVPERYKSPVEASPFLQGETTLTGPKQRELFGAQDIHTTEIRPMVLEPRLMGSTRPTWATLAEQRKLNFDVDTIQAAELSGIPEVVKAAKQLVETELTKSPKIQDPTKVTFNRKTGYVNSEPNKQGTFSRAADDFIKSNYSVLVNDSPAGKSIAGLIDKYRAETGRISGEISATLKDVVNPLTKVQYEEFQFKLDKGGDSLDPMVSNALYVARTIDHDFTQRATASGMHLKDAEGNIVPFVGKENYWPRMYDSALFENKPAFIERLIKQGLSPEAAAKAVGNARRFGERLIDPQNARILDLPEHRKDFGALLKHYDDMAHRVAAAETFGVKDIADSTTPISQLVSQTKDVGRVTKILTQYLDRESGVAPYEADVVKKITRATTFYYLSKFALSNTNQLAFVPVVTNFSATSRALGKFISNPRKTWREAEATGALQTVLQEAIREVGGESIVSKIYGIKASEGSNRTIAAIAGKYYVNDLFKKFKKNPNNPRIRRDIADLTLENPDVLLTQDILNEKQVAYAATRVSEKTQGRAQSIDLPYNWDRSPYINLLLLYKKYAFIQGKLVKDAIKSNPAKNIPLLLGLFQISGELTGDAKAAITGLMTGDPGQAIEDRGQYVGTDNKLFNRLIQNYLDSMFLGIAGETLNAAKGGKQKMLEMAAGPVVGFPAEIIGNIGDDVKNINKITRNPAKSKTVRGLASHVPYVGGALSRKLRDVSKY